MPPGLTGILRIFQIKEQKEKQQQLPSKMTFYSSLQLYEGDSVTSTPTERYAQVRPTKLIFFHWNSLHCLHDSKVRKQYHCAFIIQNLTGVRSELASYSGFIYVHGRSSHLKWSEFYGVSTYFLRQLDARSPELWLLLRCRYCVQPLVRSKPCTDADKLGLTFSTKNHRKSMRDTDNKMFESDIFA